MIRYILFKEEPCPDCEEGWVDGEVCVCCIGLSTIYTQVAVISEGEGERLAMNRGMIPFSGEPMAGPERTAKEIYGL